MNKNKRSFIKAKVLSVLYNQNNLEFPVNIKRICKSYSNIRLIPYSQYMKRHFMTYAEMLDFAETDDAFTIYNAKTDQYIIFYNDVDKKRINNNRYRWNIAHELGHIILNHHKQNDKTKLFRNSLSNSEYKMLEEEADYFASYILVPHAILYRLEISSKNSIAQCCLISDKASGYRYSDFITWKTNNVIESYDYSIIDIFRKASFRKFCYNCQYKYMSINDRFCPICNSKNIHWGYGRMKYNSNISLDENSKATICPRCENELLLDGNYCNICGLYLINHCDDREYRDYENSPCGQLLDNNSRFCPCCGNESTFYNDGILKPWNADIPFTNTSDDQNDEFVFDEELPFN